MNEITHRNGLKIGTHGLVALGLIASWSVAASADDDNARRAASLAAARGTTYASVRLPRAVSPHLRAARNLAVSRLRHGANCRALFEAEGADGILLLERATFHMATAIERSEICQPRRAAFFTTVRGTEIGVCPKGFGRLGSSHRAALLLHEALHHAGISEQPIDPRALSSTQLTRLVERQCHL